MDLPKVSIIVPVHNSIDYTLRFLETAKLLEYDNYEIIIVDDGSTDGTEEKISQLYPDVIILKGDGDYWWTKSINAGVKYALAKGTDYILTLNNDNEVDKNLLNELIKTARAHPKSVVGAKVYEKGKDNVVYIGGGKHRFLTPPHFFILPYGNIDNEKNNELREVDFITGMGCLIPAEVFNEVGCYNEDFLPQYFADAEITLRAKKHGYKLIFNPNAKIWNDVTSRSWKFPEQINFKAIKYILFHKGSPYNLKAIRYIYFTYWPKLLIIPALLILYGRCFIGISIVLVKKLIKSV